MRRFASLLGLLLLIAGCGGASPSTPSATPTPPPVAAATPTLAPPHRPTPTPSPPTVGARLTYDGRVCTYTGPKVVTAPAVLAIEFAPTKESYALNFGMVLSTTTMADAREGDQDIYGPAPGKLVPSWLLGSSWHAFWGPGTATYDLRIIDTYDQALITCVQHQWTDDQPADTVEGRVAAALIRLVPAAD